MKPGTNVVEAAKRAQATIVDVAFHEFNPFGISGVGRFQVNCYQQPKGLAGVFRRFPEEMPSLASIGLEDRWLKVLEARRGLVVITILPFKDEGNKP